MSERESVKDFFPDNTEKSTWTCRGNGETFNGETEKVDQIITFDTWFNQSGERNHVRYTAALSVADSNYETDVFGVNEQVNGRAITQGEAYYAFKGTLNGEKVDYSYMGRKGHEKLSARDSRGNFIDINEGTKEHKDAMRQMQFIDFGPPCEKP